MRKKIFNYLQVGLMIILLVFTGYLSYNELKGNSVCLPSPNQNQCGGVQSSIYGMIFGIKLGYFGFVAFLLLFLVYLGAKVEHARKKQFHKLFLLSSFIGSGFAIYFISLQIFVLKQLCESCVFIDGVMIIIFILNVIELFYELKKDKNTAAGN